MTFLIALLCVQAGPFEAEAKRAEAKLAAKPDDPAANLAVGKHLLYSGDAEKAVPFLLNCSDAPLKAAAKAEGATEGSATLIALEAGDLWTQAMAKHGALRQACLERAGFWYTRAWPDLDEAHKLKLRDRLNRLYSPLVPGKASVGQPAKWGGILDKDSGVEVSTFKVHSGGAALRVFVKKPGAKVFLQTPVVSVAPGKKLDVSVWVLSDGTDGSDSVRFVMSNSKGGQVWSAGEGVKRDLPIWTKIAASVTCPDEAFDLRLDISFASPVGSLWVDDISIRLEGKEVLKGGNFEP